MNIIPNSSYMRREPPPIRYVIASQLTKNEAEACKNCECTDLVVYTVA